LQRAQKRPLSIRWTCPSSRRSDRPALILFQMLNPILEYRTLSQAVYNRDQCNSLQPMSSPQRWTHWAQCDETKRKCLVQVLNLIKRGNQCRRLRMWPLRTSRSFMNRRRPDPLRNTDRWCLGSQPRSRAPESACSVNHSTKQLADALYNCQPICTRLKTGASLFCRTPSQTLNYFHQGIRGGPWPRPARPSSCASTEYQKILTWRTDWAKLTRTWSATAPWTWKKSCKGCTNSFDFDVIEKGN